MLAGALVAAAFFAAGLAAFGLGASSAGFGETFLAELFAALVSDLADLVAACLAGAARLAAGLSAGGLLADLAGLAAVFVAGALVDARALLVAAATRLRGVPEASAWLTETLMPASLINRTRTLLSAIDRPAASHTTRTSSAVTAPCAFPCSTSWATSGRSTIRAAVEGDELDDTNDLSMALRGPLHST